MTASFNGVDGRTHHANGLHGPVRLSAAIVEPWEGESLEMRSQCVFAVIIPRYLYAEGEETELFRLVDPLQIEL
jgi:hypothetical protein